MSVKVRVVQLGRGVIDCEVEAGTTVAGVLSSNGVPLDGMEVRVNGGAAELDHGLGDGDLITVVPLIKGGRS
jgi:sulfur carrier protein ThiS